MSSLGHQLATSVLVVGSGASGLRAAIEVAETGVAVAVVTQRPSDNAPTREWYEAAEWESTVAHPVDTGDRHAADTLRESRFLTFAERHTGWDLYRNLHVRARQLAIPVLHHVYVTRLLVDDGTVFGAYGFDLVDGSRHLVHADSVVLATGGHTRIWRHTSARRHENTGGSLRLATEAGARLRDPELVQFHPFGLTRPDSTAGMPVSERARDVGAVLLNNLGERFMTRYDAENMERSDQATVARASYTEIKEGRGSRSGGVWLDLSHLPGETVLTRLPRLHRRMLELQTLDITRDPIEVVPTAQFSLGGIWVRPEDHSTDVDGLFAVGEAAWGPHAANPPTENTLVELLVRARVTGHAAAEYSATLTGTHRSPAATRAAEADVRRLLSADGDQNVRALQRSVRQLMTEHAGVVRNEAGILAGLTGLDEIEAQAMDIGVHIDIGGFRDLAHAYDLRSTVLAARATLQCALERRETHGFHHRSDHPGTASAMRVTMLWSQATGARREPLPSHPVGLAEQPASTDPTG
ncbi:FAD-binding protein [Streptomyces sp. NPDC087305]|uniref:FAD-binding protein n=1 Tax=Streptomyces sp. NPDC087305 TaxID=3365781 RepID=UPI0038198FC5